MEQTPAKMGISLFDTIRHQDNHGEYWSARELAALLEYVNWRNFEAVIKKAMKSCENSNNQVPEHFVGTDTMLAVGNGAKRKLPDYQLSRYACYLIVQNADPEKDIIALGQTYFAVMTRKQETAKISQEQQIKDLRSRIRERDKLKRYHKELYTAAHDAGVATAYDFALFENHGYQGLYHETRDGIAARKGLPNTANISDYMGTLEEAANGFRAAMATEMMRRDKTQGLENANATHYTAGSAVRKAMEATGVPTPENLPNVPHIRHARRELKRQEQIEKEDRIGLWSTPDEEKEE